MKTTRDFLLNSCFGIANLNSLPRGCRYRAIQTVLFSLTFNLIVQVMYVDRYNIYIYISTHVFSFFLSPFHLQAKESLQHLPFFVFLRYFGRSSTWQPNQCRSNLLLVSGFTGHVAGFSRFMYKKPINSSPLAQVMFVRTNPPLLKKGAVFEPLETTVETTIKKNMSTSTRPNKKNRWKLKA